MKSRRAFTLVEILTVFAVVTLFAALITPAVNSLLRASNITHASDHLAGAMNFARQTATARNQPVELRLYQFGGPAPSFRAFQLFAMDSENRGRPLGKLERLPGSVLIDSSKELSTLLGPILEKTWTTGEPQPDLPQLGSYQTRAFQFRPDGSTSLPASGIWFLTLHNASDGDARTSPPGNFAALQIDPVTGTVSVFRP